MIRQFRAWAFGLTVALFAVTGAANAALITQTLTFTYNNFVPVSTSVPSLVTEATGSVEFTYDTATLVSIFGKARADRSGPTCRGPSRGWPARCFSSTNPASMGFFKGRQ